MRRLLLLPSRTGALRALLLRNYEEGGLALPLPNGQKAALLSIILTLFAVRHHVLCFLRIAVLRIRCCRDRASLCAYDTLLSL